MKTIDLTNKKMGIYIDGSPCPRVYWRKGRGRRCPSVLIKCGDCNNRVEIHYGYSPKEIKLGEDKNDEGIEINGVLAKKKFWKVLFKRIGL